MFDWEGRAEGLVNVKYLKIINKTFPPDDKDPTANSFNLKTRPCQRKGPSRSRRQISGQLSAARIHQNCIKNRNGLVLVPILSSVSHK